MADERVLISTHDLPTAGALREGFRKEGFAVELVTPDEELSTERPAALLVLTGGLGGEGERLAKQARETLRIPVFAIADSERLPAALRPGYDEVFPRGTPADDIVLLGKRRIERLRLQRLTGIVGETDAMREVLERVVQIAPVDATVLVTGESGTGKELVARGIHALSPRRHKPFIAVNVAALPETLLESELFGHEKGAFTGAVDSRRGLFELAEGGTIFLDEIGEMPLSTQTKLLRVLEQREFLRVGGERTIRVNVRVVAATNQDLRQLVAIGEFRRDLYYRLNVLSIRLPPLRERKEDIPLLVEAFVREVSERHGRPFPGLTPEAMAVLMEYSWPGNVRELRNLVESMVVLSPGRPIRPEDIPEEIRSGRGSSLLPAPIPRASGREGGEGTDLRPELEFIFRTLIDLRVDLDDLRREFETFRREHEPVLPAAEVFAHIPARGGDGGGVEVGAYRGPAPAGAEEGARPRDAEVRAVSPVAGEQGGGDETGAGAAPDDDLVVFRPGMTIEEMERRAIEAALAAVGGNRRRAAEMLGIGERTLYRKIAKYGLDRDD